MSTFARLDKLALLSREGFFSKLGGVKCLEPDYAYAQVYANFKCENLKDYMQLYLLNDICL